MRFKKKTTEGSVKTGLLICVGVIGLLGLTTETDLAYASCTPCEQSINGVANGASLMGTERQDAGTVVLRPKHPYWVTPDEPLDNVMRRNAKHAVDSGLWAAHLKKQQQALTQWAEEPVFPLMRPMALGSYTTVSPTGITPEALNKTFPKGTFEGVARWYVLFDERNDPQRRFVERFLKSDVVGSMNGQVRPVITGGSMKRATALLHTRVWADQGSVLTRRLGLKHWPAVVKLTPSSIVTWVPALDYDGVPLDPIPQQLGLSK